MNNYCKQEQRRMNHKHYETLIEMANGATFPDAFDYRHDGAISIWRAVVAEDTYYLMNSVGEFRLKPVPKPDIVVRECACLKDGPFVWLHGSYANNVEFTFAADDHTKPKSVRLLP